MGVGDRIAGSSVWDRFNLPTRFTRDLLWGIFIGVTLSLSSTSLALVAQGWRRRKAIARIPYRPIELRGDDIVDGVIGLIGKFDCQSGRR